MNKKIKRTPFAITSLVFGSLLIATTIVSNLGSTYYVMIDSTLGIERTEIVGEDESVSYYQTPYKTESEIVSRANEVCLEAEAEGLVLMKNDNAALPFEEGSKVSLFGTGSVNINCSAQGARSVSDKSTYPTLKEALENVGVTVNETLYNSYLTGGVNARYGGSLNSINEAPWSNFTDTITNTFSDYGDAAIMVITRDTTEGSDVKTNGTDEEISSGVVGEDGSYLSLSVQEKEILKQLTLLRQSGVFKRVIVLLNTAATIQLDFLEDSSIQVDACLWIGNTGMSGINAVAEALVGKITPSGRLSDTYLKDNFSSPAMASWMYNESGTFSNSYDADSLTTSQEYYGVYVENIYVGYRYYETRYADVVSSRSGTGQYDYSDDVCYPFGYGLSYTEFEYSNYSVTEKEDSFLVTVDVTNTGDVYSGKEVVEVYLSKPYTDYMVTNAIEVLAVELVGYQKTKSLAPNESETVTITIEKEKLKTYDTYGAKTYIVEEGDYYLAVGKDSHDANNNILAKQGYSTNDGMDSSGASELVYKHTVSQRDTTTYAVSSDTGNSVTNQLEEADINRYFGGGNNTVTYVSRNNWVNTWPTGKVTLKVTEEMLDDLTNLTLEDYDADAEIPTYNENNNLLLINLRGKDYDDADWDLLLNQLTFEEINELLSTAGGQTAALESIVKPQSKECDGPTFVKSGITNSRFPCEGIWASSFNTDVVDKIGEIMACDAKFADYDGVWCVGVNLHRTPFGGRCHEYFSEDPYLTGSMAEVEVKSMQELGVIPGAKHFAFNEQEINRNGIGTWLNEQSARELYLEPWRYVVSPKKGNDHSIMTSFNRMGCKWTSASEELVTNILRLEFGFDGYVITDLASGNGASYMTTLNGLRAGTDCWLNTNTTNSDLSFVNYESNAEVQNLMRQATHRILYTLCNYSAVMDGISESTKIVVHTVWYEILLISLLVLFALLTAASVFLYCLSLWQNKIGNNSNETGL